MRTYFSALLDGLQEEEEEEEEEKHHDSGMKEPWLPVESATQMQ